jgi:hypothetical protein
MNVIHSVFGVYIPSPVICADYDQQQKKLLVYMIQLDTLIDPSEYYRSGLSSNKTSHCGATV